MPEAPVQVPGLCLRGLVCAGVSLDKAEMWYRAPGILALNHLNGFRLLPNVYEHVKASNSHRKYAETSPIANFIWDAGMTRVPFVDKRPHFDKPHGADAFY